MSIAERMIPQEISKLPINSYVSENGHGIRQNGHDPRIVAAGWTSYHDLGDLYCSSVFSRESGLRPVALGPVTPQALRNGKAEIVNPKHDGFDYGLTVVLEKPSLLGDTNLLTSVSGISIPTVAFRDLLYGEKNFKRTPLVSGELWRIVRFGAQNGDPRLAIPYVQFNPEAVTLVSQAHYFDDEQGSIPFYNPEPSINTYAPIAGYAEEYALNIRGTDVSAKLMVTANFQGIR